jgi:hypothetical protein
VSCTQPPPNHLLCASFAISSELVSFEQSPYLVLLMLAYVATSSQVLSETLIYSLQHVLTSSSSKTNIIIIIIILFIIVIVIIIPLDLGC